MRATIFSLLIGTIIIATGCPQTFIKTRPSEKLDKDDLTVQINKYLENRQLAYYCAMTGHQVTTDVNKFVSATPYSCAQRSSSDGVITDADKLIAKRIRDETVENGIMAVNSVYTKFTDDLNTGRATTNFVADIIDIGLGAATGISKGERALHILGVSLTAFRGGRKSVDMNFFREQTIPILINKMDDNRSTLYASMILKKKQSADDYPMAEVIRDIVDYYNAGTLIRAFSQLAKDSGEKANESAKKVLQLKSADPSTIIAVPFDVVAAGNKVTTFIKSTNSTLLNKEVKQEIKEKTTENLRLMYLDMFANNALKPKLEALKATNPKLKDNMEKLENDDKTVAGTDILVILATFYSSLHGVADDNKLILDVNEIIEKHPLK